MNINKIITLANSTARLRFLAMERSLRATGCNLPLWVIPYDDQRFELPDNAIWWENLEIIDWLRKYKTHPAMRKYQCLTVGNYQFVDADVIFLNNPEITLKDMAGFVTSCGHWNNPGHTYTSDSLKVLKAKSTLWQKFVFNSGQFACDSPIYSFDELKSIAESDVFRFTCLTSPYPDQPAINMLVNASQVPVCNLTLPPYSMESTWAGDYDGQDYEQKWNDRKPYLIHWAGCDMNIGRPIDALFFKYLSAEEKEAWNIRLKEFMDKESGIIKYIHKMKNKIKRIYYIVKE